MSPNDSWSNDTTYGAVFRGIQHSLFSSDGTIITGNVDGRAIVPFPASTASHNLHLRFVDGQPAPVVRPSDGVEAALKRVFDQAEDALPSTCALSGGGPQLLPEHHELLPFSSTIVPPVAPYDLPTFGAACNHCADLCTQAGLVCDAGVAAGCIATLFGYGACVGIGGASCAAAFDLCGSNCDSNGGPCCPQECPDGSCCNAADVCAGNGNCCKIGEIVCGGQCCQPQITECNQDTCCPSDTTPCGPVCCGTGQQCADPTTGTCCAAGVQACGGTCCAVGDVCGPDGFCCAPSELCNGTCCNGGSCVNGSCCYGPVTPGGTCCDFGQSVCNGQCCDGTCVSGLCCPSTQEPCGSACCPAGSRCADPSTSTCTACGAGETGCLDPVTGQTLCCPGGAACCNGACCASGDECCFSGGQANTCSSYCYLP